MLLAPVAPDRYLPGVEAEPTDPGVRTPACALPAARRAGPADAGAVAFDVGDADLGDALLCYSKDGRPSLVQGSVEGRPVTLLGAASPLTNARLDDEGNAALALGLLGARARLVWYLPSTTDVPASAQQSFYDLVPSGVWWGLVAARGRGAAARAVASPAARAGGRRAAAGGGAGRGDGRGPGPALPAQRRPGAGRRGAARRRTEPAGHRPGAAAPGRSHPPSWRRSRPAPDGAGRTWRRSCTVPHLPTTGRWCGSPTTSTPSRERYADRDRAPARAVDRAVGRAVDRPVTSGPDAAAREALRALRAEVGKAVVGQDAAVTGLVIALLCRGHVLLEGVPGVAKTLLVRAFAAALSLDTKRVQFTPDLMPGDVTGSLVYDARSSEFSFRAGPVFTNLLLADEINRTPPKTQAALLESMEERQVSVDGTPRPLPDPFVVVATQNPVEYEGTYPLPEAQLDRFLLKLTMPLPARDEEMQVLTRHAEGFDPRDLGAAGIRPVAGTAELAAGRAAVRTVTIRPEVVGYVVDLARATRDSPSLQLGVSPRGATALMSAARAWAWLSGRDYVTPDDVKALARPALRHRVELRPEAELEGVTPDAVLDGVLGVVPVPR